MAKHFKMRIIKHQRHAASINAATVTMKKLLLVYSWVNIKRNYGWLRVIFIIDIQQPHKAHFKQGQLVFQTNVRRWSIKFRRWFRRWRTSWENRCRATFNTHTV